MVGHSSIQPKVRTNGKEKERPNIRSSHPARLVLSQSIPKPNSAMPLLSESPANWAFPHLAQPSGGGTAA